MVQSQVSTSCRHVQQHLYKNLTHWLFCMVHLMFETSWISTGGHVAEEIVIILDGARDGDCVPDTNVVTKCVIMDVGKWSVWICQIWMTGLLAMQNDWFDVRMFVQGVQKLTLPF